MPTLPVALHFGPADCSITFWRIIVTAATDNGKLFPVITPFKCCTSHCHFQQAAVAWVGLSNAGLNCFRINNLIYSSALTLPDVQITWGGLSHIRKYMLHFHTFFFLAKQESKDEVLLAL